MKHLADKIKESVKQKHISVQKHADADLFIYNYSPVCQYDKIWNEVTLVCRGLILDSQYNVVARPFSKFFNYSELSPTDIPNEPFEVYTKMDGSLGVLYWLNDMPFISTRGSFESEQAKKANEILYSKYAYLFDKLKHDRTYLFEIIYPSNRIVVDYGEMQDLILLSVIDNATGKDLPLENIGFPIVKRHDGIDDINILSTLEKENEEGFVIKFKGGMRCKIKFSEYVRLHKILTQTSNIAIWECLRDNKPLDELLDRIPDEFYAWVKKTKEGLESDYQSISMYARSAFNKTYGLSMENGQLNRKAFALEVMKNYKDISGVIFNILDGKDCNAVIWKMLRPKYSKPFKSEI